MSNANFTAPILALALKTAERGPMQEVDEATAEEYGGLVGCPRPTPYRGITLLSAGQWAQVQNEIGRELPWHTRRANVLLDADGLGDLIGLTLRAGEVEMRVMGETRPCGLMDELCPGLRKALTGDCRGGVHAWVLKGGTLRVGDTVTVIEDARREGPTKFEP